MSDVERMAHGAAINILGITKDAWDGMLEDERYFAKEVATRALLSLGLPLETLAALKEGTWRAVPLVPTDDMARPLTRLWLMADQEPTAEDMQCAREYAAAMLAAAPAKPGDE